MRVRFGMSGHPWLFDPFLLFKDTFYLRLATCGGEGKEIFWGHPKPRQGAKPPAPPSVGITMDRVSYLRENARLTIECFLCTVSEVVKDTGRVDDTNTG